MVQSEVIKPARFDKKLRIENSEPVAAVDFIAANTPLSKSAIKVWMNSGGVWLRVAKQKGLRRLRRASTLLRNGDQLELYYDPDLLARDAPEPACIYRSVPYSIWFKPAGMLSQGNEYGDHCALLRHVEKTLPGGTAKAYLIHRLDREASGVMVVAHDSKAAERLSVHFRDGKVAKIYTVEVLGDVVATKGTKGKIDLPLDSKPALTEYECLETTPGGASTLVRVTLHTGRLHQIRRHFDAIGHPVLGDPKYGRGNKNDTGLKLVASELGFRCPWRKVWVTFRADDVVQ